MNKFLFKSSDADFQKLLQQINKNVLYVTYVVDMILKKINEMDTDDNLQNQVDKFYEDGSRTDGKEPA